MTLYDFLMDEIHNNNIKNNMHKITSACINLPPDRFDRVVLEKSLLTYWPHAIGDECCNVGNLLFVKDIGLFKSFSATVICTNGLLGFYGDFSLFDQLNNISPTPRAAPPSPPIMQAPVYTGGVGIAGSLGNSPTPPGGSLSTYNGVSFNPVIPLLESKASAEGVHVASNVCPVCKTEAEDKTFSTFSYKYCPKCKEDIAHLIKNNKPQGIDSEAALEYTAIKYGQVVK